MSEDKLRRSQVNQNDLPNKFPTHGHEAAFWESLGRTVATFGFLEEILKKAIFAFTATITYEDSESEQAYDKWLSKLECTLSDPLGNLIKTYESAVRAHPDAAIENLDYLLIDLREIAQIRNILCHGSWGLPDTNGASIPLFINRKLQIVDTAIDQQSIDQVQRHTVKLICAVINTVTTMGWQFPSIASQGKKIW